MAGCLANSPYRKSEIASFPSGDPAMGRRFIVVSGNRWNIKKLKASLLAYSINGIVDAYYGAKPGRKKGEYYMLMQRIKVACRALGLVFELNREKAALFQEGRRIDAKLGPKPAGMWAKEQWKAAMHEATHSEHYCPSIC